MTFRYMLDTNTVSDLMRWPDGRVARELRTLGPGWACASIVTAAELRYGAHKVRSRRLLKQIETVLTLVPPLPLNLPADEKYASIRVALEQNVRPIGPNDLLIAAHALALGLTLVTANQREFSRVPGLILENWLD